MSPVDTSTFQKDLAAVKKRRKDAGPRRGDEAIPIEKIPLESPTLMRVTDGGIAIGRIARFFGGFSSGKSHCAFLSIAAAQAFQSERFPKGLDCMLWNVEGTYEEAHARRLGVDTSSLYLDDTQIIEEIAEGMETLLRSRHLHVIDSTSDAKCVDELANDSADWTIGLQARAWKRAAKRIEARFDSDENVIIMISHVGTRIDTKRHSSYTYPKDGEHLEYISSLNLEFDAGAWLFYHPDGHLEKKEKVSEDVGVSPNSLTEPDGVEITVRCRKNKTGRQHRVGKMRFDLNSFMFDTAFELHDGGLFFDEDGNPAHRSEKPAIIQKAGGSWYMLPDGNKVNGATGIRQELDRNPELVRLIRNAMIGGK